MRNSFRTLVAICATALLTTWTSTSPAQAQEQTCKREQFADLIDETGRYLRDFSGKNRPQLLKLFSALAKARGWPAETASERGYQLVQDRRITEYDTRARQLLIEMDRIDEASENEATCVKLKRLQAVSLELRTVTAAKFKHMQQRARAALATTPAGRSGDQAASPATAASNKPLRQTPPRSPTAAVKAGKSRPPMVSRQAKPPPGKPASKRSPWQTTTTETRPPAAAPAPLAALRQLPPPAALPRETTFTAREIRQAGRGFFGSMSAGLASIIQYTFENYGAPNGYILGTEGGAAFLAGLSFGKGRLTTKTAEPMKVFWQGPSVGYDFGLQGSRVMFLVYNLGEPRKIFARYAGVSGSAYIVGGAGLTYHKRGRVVLAPIRTGLGLRVGANIGYLKFTPRLSINPF